MMVSIHTCDDMTNVAFCKPPTKDRCSHRCLCQTAL